MSSEIRRILFSSSPPSSTHWENDNNLIAVIIYIIITYYINRTRSTYAQRIDVKAERNQTDVLKPVRADGINNAPPFIIISEKESSDRRQIASNHYWNHVRWTMRARDRTTCYCGWSRSREVWLEGSGVCTEGCDVCVFHITYTRRGVELSSWLLASLLRHDVTEVTCRRVWCGGHRRPCRWRRMRLMFLHGVSCLITHSAGSHQPYVANITTTTTRCSFKQVCEEAMMRREWRHETCHVVRKTTIVLTERCYMNVYIQCIHALIFTNL